MGEYEARVRELAEMDAAGDVVGYLAGVSWASWDFDVPPHVIEADVLEASRRL